MNCARARRFLQQNGWQPGCSFPTDIAQHLFTCEGCHSRFSAAAGAQPISPGVEQRIGANLIRSLEPVSPLPPRKTLVFQTITVFVFLPALILTLLGTEGIRATTWLQLAGMLAVIAAAEAQLSLSLCELMVPGCRHRPSPRTLLLTILPVYAVAALLLYPENEALQSVQAGQQCARVACLTAVPATVVLWMLARRGAVLSWGTAGATIGLLAALAGASVLAFSCTTPERLHVLTWHAGVVVICTIAGLLLGKLIAEYSSF